MSNLNFYIIAPADYVNYMENNKNKAKPKPSKAGQKVEEINEADLPTALIGI